MLKLKLQYFSHPMQRAYSLEKNSDAGKDWREEKGMIEDEMVGWHHQLNGHEFEQAPGDGKDGEAWPATVHGLTESDMTKWLNDNSSYSCLDFEWKRASALAIQLTTGNCRCVVIHHPVSHSYTASFGEAMPPNKGFPSLASLQSGKITLLRYSYEQVPCGAWERMLKGSRLR